MAGLGLGGNMNVNASPNLWDQTADAKQNKLKGVQSLRPVYSGLGNMEGTAAGFQQAGTNAMGNAMDMYAAQAMGTAPSLANAQMQQGIAQNNQAALGMLGQSRGGNIAGSYQQALGAQGGANVMAAQQGAINRMAEQQAGLAGYAGLAGQTGQLGLGYSQLASQNALQGDQNALGWYAADRGMDLQQQAGDRQFIGGMINSGISAAGSMAGGLSAMSDERAKTGVTPLADGGAGSAVAEIAPIAFEYQPGMGAPGQRVGVSAQQLAGTSLGPALVQQGPDGLGRVDVGGAATTALAASADQEHRLRALERMYQAGGDATRYGTAEEGAMREREAASMSNAIAQQRGLGQVQRGREEGMGGPAYNFGNMPTMQREWSPTGRAYAIDPFEGEPQAPPQRVPDPHGGEVAVLPSRRRMLGGPSAPSEGMRGQNVGAIYDKDGNPIDYRADIVPYESGSASPQRADLRRAPSSEPISPEWQAAIDAMNDYNDQWLATDETGKRVYRGAPLDLGQTPRNLQREIDSLDAADRDRAIMEYDKRNAARPMPQRML